MHSTKRQFTKVSIIVFVIATVSFVIVARSSQNSILYQNTSLQDKK